MLAVAGVTTMDDSVLVPLELVVPTPAHPIPANVKARVEAVRKEQSKKRRVSFILFIHSCSLLQIGMSVSPGVALGAR